MGDEAPANSSSADYGSVFFKKNDVVLVGKSFHGFMSRIVDECPSTVDDNVRISPRVWEIKI